uniref:Uncharacterized protein n=1 Tax=Nelumbo nucifera TaxID=4432 RepID=A0A822XXL2_NELNU|nr:TPA_asm: hypothetical protein HUJ06_025927 [Nelumbo nucifera]
MMMIIGLDSIMLILIVFWMFALSVFGIQHLHLFIMKIWPRAYSS